MSKRSDNFELGKERKVFNKKGGSFAIMRHAKLNNFGSIAGSLKHCFRDIDTPNADPNRTPDNKHLFAKSTDEAIDRIKERLDGLARPPRSNSVRCVEYVMTASPEWFAKATPDQQQQFFDNSLEYLKNTYGEENIVVASIHHDETTPHLSAYVVPITEDGRLSARDFLGGRQKLRDAQTKFAEMQADLGLQRGVEGSRATHTTIKDYYSHLDTQKTLEALPEPKKRLIGHESAKDYQKTVAEHLAKAKTAVFSAETRAERAEATYKHLSEQLKTGFEELEQRTQVLDEREQALQVNERAVNHHLKTISEQSQVIETKRAELAEMKESLDRERLTYKTRLDSQYDNFLAIDVERATKPLKEELQTYKQAYADVSKQLADVNHSSDDLLHTVNELETDNVRLRGEIKELNSLLAEFEEYRQDNLEAVKKSFEKHIEPVMRSLHPFNDDYKAIKKGLQSFLEGAKGLKPSQTSDYVSEAFKALQEDFKERLPRIKSELERDIER